MTSSTSSCRRATGSSRPRSRPCPHRTPSLAANGPNDHARKRRKNQPYFDLRAQLHRIAGVDLTRLEGIDAMTAFSVLSETGMDMTRFPSEKAFASWMHLCPNNRVTGGRVRSRRVMPGANRAGQALKLAAQSLHHSKSALGAFFRRMKARLGPQKAIIATAHKLARLIYRLLKYGEAYVAQSEAQYQELTRKRALTTHQASPSARLRPRSHRLRGGGFLRVPTGGSLVALSKETGLLQNTPWEDAGKWTASRLVLCARFRVWSPRLRDRRFGERRRVSKHAVVSRLAESSEVLSASAQRPPLTKEGGAHATRGRLARS